MDVEALIVGSGLAPYSCRPDAEVTPRLFATAARAALGDAGVDLAPVAIATVALAGGGREVARVQRGAIEVFVSAEGGAPGARTETRT